MKENFPVFFSFVNSILGSSIKPKCFSVNENRNEYKASLLPSTLHKDYSRKPRHKWLRVTGLGSYSQKHLSTADFSRYMWAGAPSKPRNNPGVRELLRFHLAEMKALSFSIPEWLEKDLAKKHGLPVSTSIIQKNQNVAHQTISTNDPRNLVGECCWLFSFT